MTPTADATLPAPPPRSPEQEAAIAYLSLAREDPREYVKTMIAAVDQESVHEHEFHELIYDSLLCCLREGKHLQIVAPPEHIKSTMVRHFLCYLKGKNRRIRVGMTSGDFERGKKTMTSIRKVLMSRENQILFPDVRPDAQRVGRDKSARFTRGEWSSECLYLEGDVTDPSFELFPFEGEALGSRVDLFLFDDVVTQKCENSETARNNCDDKIHGTFLSRLTDTGIAIFLSNVWHRNDPTHRLARSPAVHTLWIGYNGTDELYWRVHNPCESWKHGESGVLPLWEAVWPKQRLIRRMEASRENPGRFRKLFGGKALSKEDMLFPPHEDWKTFSWEQVKTAYVEGARLYSWEDIASGRTLQRHDYAANMVVMIGQDKQMYWLDCWMDRVSPEEQAMIGWLMHEKWTERLGGAGLNQHTLEFPANMASRDTHINSWGSLLMSGIEKTLRTAGRGEWRLPWNVAYQPSNASKWPRIEACVPYFKTSQLLVPPEIKDLALHDQSWRVAVAQLEEFPPKSNTDHDDGPDALAGAIKQAREGGPGMSSDKRTEREIYKARTAKPEKAVMNRDPLTGRAAKTKPRWNL